MTRTKTNATTTRAFLSVQEVAALLGEHRSTCYRSIERGDFPIPVVTINGRLRVPRPRRRAAHRWRRCDLRPAGSGRAGS